MARVVAKATSAVDKKKTRDRQQIMDHMNDTEPMNTDPKEKTAEKDGPEIAWHVDVVAAAARKECIVISRRRVRVRDACGPGPAAPPSALRVAAMTAAGALGDSIPWRREGSGDSAKGRSMTARWCAARAWGRAPSKAARRREWAADVDERA